MKKKLLFCSVIVAMIFSLLPICASAAGEKEFKVGTESELRAAVQEINTAEEGDFVITLTDNIELVSDVDLLFGGNAVTTIKGEGYTLTFYDNSLDISDNATVNLGGEDYDKTLTLTSDVGKASNTQAIIRMSKNATLNMYANVTIGPNRAGGQAGGVQLEGSSRFNMYGGEIAECVDWASVAGGVVIDEAAKFTMKDGTIRDCSGYRGGGVGVFDNGSFVMDGGTIKNCTDGWFGGGAVNVWGSCASFVMNDGLIEGCKATDTSYGLGGAVFIYSATGNNAINDGEIKKNSTVNYGGGILLYSGSLSIAEGVKIHNNQADGAGDDLMNFRGTLTFADVPQGLVLESTQGAIDGWYADGVVDNVDTARWNLEASDTAPIFVQKYTPSESVVTSQLALKAAHSAYTYTIEYYLNGKIDDTLTETGTSYTDSLDNIPDKCPDGYKQEKVENSGIEPATDANSLGSFTVRVYYTKEASSSTPKYTLSYESNGGTQYADERYKRNTVVSLDVVPTREGYTFTGWYADAELTEKITEIKMTGNQTVYAGWKVSTVPGMLNGDDHFAYVIGYEDDTVRLLANISRAETAAIFFRLLNEEVRDGNLTVDNSFDDVESGAWYNQAISTMEKLGIVNGRDDDSFDPNAPITRAEFAAICARFDDSETDTGSNFSDIENHWAKAEIEHAAALGWIKGYEDGTFGPNKYITRAEAMTMINRVLCRIPENDDDLLADMNVWSDNNPQDWYYLAVQEATNSHNYEHKGEIYESWTELTPDPDWTKYQK